MTFATNKIIIQTEAGWCRKCGCRRIDITSNVAKCLGCGETRKDVNKKQITSAKEAIMATSKTKKTSSKATAGRGRRGMLYALTAAGKKEDYGSGQEAVVFAALRKLGTATSAQIAAACKGSLRKSAQTPERVVGYYLNLWKGAKLVTATKQKAA